MRGSFSIMTNGLLQHKPVNQRKYYMKENERYERY